MTRGGLTELPRSLDLKDRMSSVKNQADRGSCSFFSIVGLMKAAIKNDMSIDVNLSEEFLIYATKN